MYAAASLKADREVRGATVYCMLQYSGAARMLRLVHVALLDELQGACGMNGRI